MKRPLTLWIISDGKPGHLNQSLGLAEAMARLTECDLHTISVAGARGAIGRVREAVRQSGGLPQPDYLLAAGHTTHLPMLSLARKTGAKSIVLMRPSLPVGWFDYCIAPEHDFPKGSDRPNLILTHGALNRVVPGGAEKTLRLLLIGGPSKIHGWDGEAMLLALGEITASDPGGLPWVLTDSRRTPSDFITSLSAQFPHIAIHSHHDTPPGWVPEHLARASEAWVSEDSVSMVYEALTSGARVGLLPVPRLRDDARVLRGLDSLVADRWVTPYATWQTTRILPVSSAPLHEADRCARVVLGFSGSSRQRPDEGDFLRM